MVSTTSSRGAQFFSLGTKWPWLRQSSEARGAAEAVASDLLRQYGIGGVILSLVASVELAMASVGQVAWTRIRFWWPLVSAVLLLRISEILLSRYRILSSRADFQDFGRLGAALSSSAILCASFACLSLPSLDKTTRAFTLIVLCGMAVYSLAALAPSKILSFVSCSLLLFPAAMRMLYLPGSQNTFLGILGFALFLVMLGTSSLARRAVQAAVELPRSKEALVLKMLEGRQRTAAANSELKIMQRALWEANHRLEVQVEARTADLNEERRENERYAKELADLASTDPLTGLYNRATLSKRLSEILLQTRIPGESVALLFIDLDKFKEVNDVWGHPVGDQVLRAVAQRLQRLLPPIAALSRWGGDEFVVVFPELDSVDQALKFANILRECVREPIRSGTGAIRVGATVGISLFPEHGHTAEELIHAADLAMYAGKEAGNSDITLFNMPLNRRMTERHHLVHALREAIDTHALRIVFQPIVDSSDGKCEALEALARWDHPVRGLIPPAEFIPLAERIGEISAIGRWMLKEACVRAAAWPGARPPCVSVNISVAQATSGTLLADVSESLKASGLPPDRLRLELTESVFAGDHRVIIPTLLQLREMGIRISLDDFGTGFSCLANLRRLPLNQIKIAKEFVESLNTDSVPIVKVILATAQTFGLDVVAEGVETLAQADCLVCLGVRFLQGRLFSDVLSPEAALEWIRACHFAAPNALLRLSASSKL